MHSCCLAAEQSGLRPAASTGAVADCGLLGCFLEHSSLRLTRQLALGPAEGARKTLQRILTHACLCIGGCTVAVQLPVCSNAFYTLPNHVSLPALCSAVLTQ